MESRLRHAHCGTPQTFRVLGAQGKRVGEGSVVGLEAEGVLRHLQRSASQCNDAPADAPLRAVEVNHDPVGRQLPIFGPRSHISGPPRSACPPEAAIMMAESLMMWGQLLLELVQHAPRWACTHAILSR